LLLNDIDNNTMGMLIHAGTDAGKDQPAHIDRL